jgi:hypothetical protein
MSVVYHQALLGVGQSHADCTSPILLKQEPIIFIRGEPVFSSSSATTHFLNLARSAVSGKTIGASFSYIELLYVLRPPTLRAPLGSRLKICLVIKTSIMPRFDEFSVVLPMLAPVNAIAFRTPWLQPVFGSPGTREFRAILDFFALAAQLSRIRLTQGAISSLGRAPGCLTTAGAICISTILPSLSALPVVHLY